MHPPRSSRARTIARRGTGSPRCRCSWTTVTTPPTGRVSSLPLVPPLRIAERGSGGEVMCGIFGAVSLNGEPLRHPDCLHAMAATLAHRGPDGERIVGHESAQLGARRLAIMDLTTGDQPFQSPDGAIWMVCNGEIYNARELRREATGWGYPFRSRGDIENIVPFYERFGAAAVERLEGMFGLAIWDDQRRVLVLARDRAGEKPLFWTEIGGELRFASEIQALLAYPDQPRRLDPHAAALYAALGYVPAPHTMFAGVHKLPPAHRLQADGAGLDIHPYWDPAAAAARPSQLESPAQLREVLLRAVARELVSEGADELFGGSPTYLGHKAAGLYRRLPGRGVLRWLVNQLPTSTGKVTFEFLLKQLVAAAELPALERHLQWFGALGPAAGIVPELACKLTAFPKADPLNRLLWLDFLTYLPDNLLVKVDRGTMLASVEARAPYLDREVMELVLPAPSRLKVHRFTTKVILKEAARGLVPAAVIRRRKRGLSVPVARWLNTSLAPLADRLLLRPRLGGSRVPQLLREHRSGRANHARKLW